MSAAAKPNAKPARDLCIMACVFCRDPVFWAWLNQAGIACQTSDDAKDAVLDLCAVASRSHIDTDPAAAQRFHQLVRAPFVFWRQERQDREHVTDWSAA